MCHAAKRINCATRNDEYFENHYQLSQGLLKAGDDERYDSSTVQTLLVSKCQGYPLSTDGKLRHRKVRVTVDGEYCPRCKSSAPLSLKILSCSKILKRKEMTEAVVSLLPATLIKVLMEVGLNVLKKDDWDVVKNSISILLEYWPYEVLKLKTLTDDGWHQIALAHLILDTIKAEIDSDTLKKPFGNQISEFVMRTSVDSVLDQLAFCRIIQRKLFSIVCDEKRRWVFDCAGPRKKYIITTEFSPNTEKDLHRILYMLRLCRKPGSPFEVRVVKWYLDVEKMSTLAEIFQEINPEVVKWFAIRIEPKDILKLDRILKPCVHLTALTLTLNHGNYHLDDNLRQNLANDVSLLISHHPTIKRLCLIDFRDLIVGYGYKYCLPTSLDTLALHNCVLTHVDLEHWTDACTKSHIEDLLISGRCSNCPSDTDGILKFVEKLAESLVSLHMDLSANEHQPTVDHLKRMAKRLAKFDKLQRLTYHVQNVRDILEILRDVMPSINQSLHAYTLCCLLGCNKDFLRSLQLEMKARCIERKRLLDFASLVFYVDEDFQDGIPIVKFEDLWGVMGFQCSSLGEYGCEHDVDEDLDFDQ